MDNSEHVPTRPLPRIPANPLPPVPSYPAPPVPTHPPPLVPSSHADSVQAQSKPGSCKVSRTLSCSGCAQVFDLKQGNDETVRQKTRRQLSVPIRQRSRSISPFRTNGQPLRATDPSTPRFTRARSITPTRCRPKQTQTSKVPGLHVDSATAGQTPAIRSCPQATVETDLSRSRRYQSSPVLVRPQSEVLGQHRETITQRKGSDPVPPLSVSPTRTSRSENLSPGRRGPRARVISTSNAAGVGGSLLLSTSTSSSAKSLENVHPLRLDMLRIFIVSWNMGNAPPPDMTPILHCRSARRADVIVIGLQESYSSKKSRMPEQEEELPHQLSDASRQQPERSATLASQGDGKGKQAGHHNGYKSYMQESAKAVKKLANSQKGRMDRHKKTGTAAGAGSTASLLSID